MGSGRDRVLIWLNRAYRILNFVLVIVVTSLCAWFFSRSTNWRDWAATAFGVLLGVYFVYVTWIGLRRAFTGHHGGREQRDQS